MTTQKTNTSEIRPDFNHRIDGNISNPRDLADIISMMAFRAKGVLELVSVNLAADTKANDEIVNAAIIAAIAEIEDINATIQAFHQAVSVGGAV